MRSKEYVPAMDLKPGTLAVGVQGGHYIVVKGWANGKCNYRLNRFASLKSGSIASTQIIAKPLDQPTKLVLMNK